MAFAFRAAVLGLCASVLVGCSDSDSPSSLGPTSGASVQSSVQPSVAAGSCRSRCVFPHAPADVDGDGDPDRIVVLLDACDAYGRCRQHVEVETANGRASRVDPALCAGGDETSLGDGYLGAGDIDGRPGAEVAYIQCGGPHSRWGWILTWRNDRLERVRRNGHDFNFIIDSAITVEVLLACDTAGSEPLLVETAISPDGGDLKSWSGEAITMRFDIAGDLQEVNTVPLHFNVAEGEAPPIRGGILDCPGFESN